MSFLTMTLSLEEQVFYSMKEFSKNNMVTKINKLFEQCKFVVEFELALKFYIKKHQNQDSGNGKKLGKRVIFFGSKSLHTVARWRN